MSQRIWKRANPFFVLLMVVSTAFVVTALGYLIAPMVQQQAREHPGAKQASGSLELAAWLERRAPLALGVEIGAIVVTGLLAMLTDHWFSPRRGGNEAGSQTE